MNVAILHYHLNRGGVTRVIENQLVSLDAVLDPQQRWRVAVLYGGRQAGWGEDVAQRIDALDFSLCEVPLLDYDTVRADVDGNDAHSTEPLFSQLTAALDDLGFAPQQTVLHVHNHSLGKNRCLPRVVAQLAEAGYAVLLQVHDFAEDFRPENYGNIGDPGSAGLYPQGPAIHYAVLNGRDHGVLADAGVAPQRLHLLPNPTPPIDGLPPKSDAREKLRQLFDVAPTDRFLLYPVRCIRRKNVGEALLYSALAPPGTVVGLTLPPLNPLELSIYEEWQWLATELGLPCRFSVGGSTASLAVGGAGLSFPENLAAADGILTTSLAEGFGMAFLESSQAGHVLLGRDLPEITRDFVEMGMRFDWLRPELRVPVEWVGSDVRESLVELYRCSLETYDRPMPSDLAEQLEVRVADGLVDFGDLDEQQQEQVLRAVCESSAARRRVVQLNESIDEALSIDADSVLAVGGTAAAVIESNARCIDEHLSPDPSGRRLRQLYEQVAVEPRAARPEPLRAPQRILDRFLDFRRFRPIRS